METPGAPLGAESPSRFGGASALLWGVGVFVVHPAVSWPIQGLLFRLGVPGGLVRWGIGAIPDAAAIGLVVAGLVHALRTRQRPDRLDAAVAAFVALAAGHLVVDRLALAAGHDLLADGPNGLYVQVVALRAAIVAPLLFVALRSFRRPTAIVPRLLDLVLVAAVVLAAGAVLEAVFPDTWERIGTEVLRINELRRGAYGVLTRDDIVEYTGVGDRLVVRAGSFLLEYLQLGFILVPGVTLALLRAARAPKLGNVACLGVVTGGIVATAGRAALAATAVAGLVVLVTRPPGPERRRLQIIGGAAAILLLAVALGTGLVSRVLATTEEGDQSTSVHVDSSGEALEIIGDHPLGVGLGTGVAAAARPHPGTDLITENAYLDIGMQVGVLAAASFVVVVAAIGRELWRRRTAGDEVVVALASFVALGIGGFVLNTWQMLETTWLVFALAALALPRVAEHG